MKKNIAIMMTGITVATAVAPVFAAEAVEGKTINFTIDSKDSSKLVDEVRAALDVVYQETKAGKTVGERAYLIKIDNKVITNAKELENKINALKDGESLVVTMQDQGHQVIDNKVVDYKIEQYKSANEIVEDAKKAELVSKVVSTNTVEIRKTETSEEVVTVKVGQDKLNFEKEVLDTKGKLVGFETANIAIEADTTYAVTVNKSDAETVKVDLETLYDGVRLTNEGRILTEALREEGQTVAIENKSIDASFAGKEAKFDIVIRKDDKIVKVITVSNKDQELVDAFEVIVEGIINNEEEKVVTTVAGDSRFTTAVEVSKQRFEKEGDANAVILVGEEAIVDGLAAAPLATQENAPILLAKKDALTEETEAEIIRALGKDGLDNKTIYLVGGEARISAQLETQLKELGVKIERLAGDSRQETSVAIAKKLKMNTTAFVVGADGEADAMSISSKAAQKDSIAPIIVADANGVSEKAEALLDGKQIEIIGGVNAVSEAAEAELAKIDTDKKVVRLAGETRKDTNALVINRYFGGSKSTTQAYVAKDGYVGGNGKLIDALTSAPLAAKNNAPIILTTDALSKSQEEVIELKLTKVTEVTQVGNGIAKTAIEKIVEKLKSFN